MAEKWHLDAVRLDTR